MQSTVNRTNLKFKKAAKHVDFGKTTTTDDIAEQVKLAKRKTKEELLPVRQALPIYEYRDALINAIKLNQNTIVVGETGSGKTTQVPQYLYEAGLVSRDPKAYECIAITQPRRVAAMTLAERVSQEVGTALGDAVGYTIRFDDKSSPQTKLKFLTDGMLLREIQVDPKLTRYKVVVLDEAHERTLNTDILFGLLKKLQAEHRPDLKLVVMSATLDADKFSKYLNNAPVALIPGRTHPVDVHYIDKEANERENKNKINLSDSNDLVVATVLQLHQDKPLDGDILCFMSGSDEIQTVREQLLNYNKELQQYWKEKQQKKGEKLLLLKQMQGKAEIKGKDGANAEIKELRGDGSQEDALLLSQYDMNDEPPPEMCVLPLYSTLAPEQQLLAFAPAPPGTRKIILSTNIAETSVTVSGVKYVVDTGLHKQKTYTHGSGVGSLQNHIVSKAEAQQRTGRAGREQPGECYRLYTEEAFEKDFQATPIPEIQRSSLSSSVLQLKSLNIDDIYTFPLIDTPSALAIDSALKELVYFNAITLEGKMTELGRIMSTFPIEPVFSRMLILSAKPELLFLTSAASGMGGDEEDNTNDKKLSNRKQQQANFEKSKEKISKITVEEIKKALGAKDGEAIDLSLLYTACSEEMCIVVAALSVDNLVVQIAQTQSQNALRLKVETLQREYYSQYGDMFFYYNILKTFLQIKNNDERFKWCKKYHFNYRNLMHAMNVYQQLCVLLLSTCNLPLISSVQEVKPKFAFTFAQFLRNKQNQLLETNVDPGVDSRLYNMVVQEYLQQNPPTIAETMSAMVGINGHNGMNDDSDSDDDGGDARQKKTSKEYDAIGKKGEKTEDFDEKKHWEVNIAKCLTAGLFRNLCYMNLEGHHVDFQEQKRVFIHPTSVLNYFIQVERRDWKEISQNNRNRAGGNGVYGGSSAMPKEKTAQSFATPSQGGNASASQPPKSFREYTKYATLLFFELLITKQRYIRGALRINQDWLQIYGRLFYQQETAAFQAFNLVKEVEKNKGPGKMEHDEKDSGVNNSMFGARSAFSNLTSKTLAHTVGLGSGERATNIHRKKIEVDAQNNIVKDPEQDGDNNNNSNNNNNKRRKSNDFKKESNFVSLSNTTTPQQQTRGGTTGVQINKTAFQQENKYSFLGGNSNNIDNNNNPHANKRKSFGSKR